MMTFHSETPVKRRNELPNRIKKIEQPSESLERLYNQANTKIAESTKALLKAQLIAGQHNLTRESFVMIAEKYGWQYRLFNNLFR